MERGSFQPTPKLCPQCAQPQSTAAAVAVQPSVMTWDQAAFRALGWLAGLCLIGTAINLLGSTMAGYYVGFFAAPAAVIVALLARVIHGTWRVPAMICLIGVTAGIALSLLALAGAR